MLETNPGWKRLSELKPKVMSLGDMSEDSKEKIRSTTKYSLESNPNQTIPECFEKCMIAIMAEEYVKDHVDGIINHGQEDLEDPYTYAYDVIAHPKYSGLRIEVKTHQSNSKWVVVNSGMDGDCPGTSGINLGPFLKFGVADVIIIFKTEKVSQNTFRLIPYILSDQYALSTKNGSIQKSKFDGYYLTGRINHDKNFCFKVFTSKNF